MNQPEILALLLAGQPVSLAAWFAEPRGAEGARRWLPKIRRQAQMTIGRRERGAALRLAELIVRYWCGHDVDVDYRNNLALTVERRERAMLEICYGQLLIARRCRQAWPHLDAGFTLAAHLLEPDEYFLVLKRHELLRALPLSVTPAEPARLEELLTEARVIRELKGRGPGQPRAGTGHQDTVD